MYLCFQICNMYIYLYIYMYLHRYTYMKMWIFCVYECSNQAGPKLTPGHTFTYCTTCSPHPTKSLWLPPDAILIPRVRVKNPSDYQTPRGQCKFKATCTTRGTQLKSPLDHGFLMDLDGKILTKTPSGWLNKLNSMLDWGLWYSDVKWSGPDWLCSPPIFVLSSLVCIFKSL